MSPAFDRSFETLEVRLEGDLLRVTLNNPRKANALAPAMIAEVTALYSRPLRAEGVRAVLLQGAGKHFSAGADLEHLKSLRDAGRRRTGATQTPCGRSSRRCCARRR